MCQPDDGWKAATATAAPNSTPTSRGRDVGRAHRRHAILLKPNGHSDEHSDGLPLRRHPGLFQPLSAAMRRGWSIFPPGGLQLICLLVDIYLIPPHCSFLPVSSCCRRIRGSIRAPHNHKIDHFFACMPACTSCLIYLSPSFWVRGSIYSLDLLTGTRELTWGSTRSCQ